MNKIKEILAKYKIKECSMEQRFEINSNGRIDGESFVLGFFKMLSKGKNTIESWAGEIYNTNGEAISSQALHAKLSYRHQKFPEELFKKILREVVLGRDLNENEDGLLSNFNRVYIEDSTCIALPDSMFEYFPGTVNQKGASSSARIQLRMELKSGDYSHVSLKNYRNNDQSYSPNILNQLKEGDLVIRDLGYWSLDVYRQITNEAKANLISRFMFQTHVFEPKTNEKIELYAKLRSLRKKGFKKLEMNVLVGKKEKLPMRLIAIKVPPQIEQKRKRKLRGNRSKDYMEMLGWCIYITNIEKNILSAEQVQEIYGYRWRIEIVFKCWKSKFNLYFLFNKKKRVTASRVYISFYLVLIWLTVFFVKWYNYFLIKVFEEKNKIISLFKFADFFKENFFKIHKMASEEKTITYLARYCSQQKRSKKSDIELIYLLNLP